MIIAQLVFARVAFSNIIAVGLDLAGISSLLAAGTACVALFFAQRTSRKQTKNTEAVSYVDNNLRTMQTTLDWLTADNKHLRDLNEIQRLQIIEHTRELESVHAELEQCKQVCKNMQKRMTELGDKNE